MLPLAPIVVGVAMNAAQKTAATVATKVVTSAVATYVGCAVQNEIMKQKQQEFETKAAQGITLTVEDIATHKKEVFVSAAVATGVCAGVGMIANNIICDAINSL